MYNNILKSKSWKLPWILISLLTFDKNHVGCVVIDFFLTFAIWWQQRVFLFSFFSRTLYSAEKKPSPSIWFYSFRHCLRILWENVLLKRLHYYNKKKSMEIHLSSCIAPKQLLSPLWWECGNQAWRVMNNSQKWMFAECI